RRLARARGVRPVGGVVHRPPRPDAHPAGRRLGRPPPAQGLRVPAGVPRHSRPLMSKDVVLSVLAHPDDAEFLCAGALIRLAREHGWRVHLASMTPGDCGSAELSADAIASVRRQEGAAAARLIGAEYHCLEERDLRIVYAEGP